MKILIVDEKEENLYLLESLLKWKGYEVTSARNGVEALEKLKKDSIYMIISDISMPKIDGFQLCRECKSDDKLRKIPFIFYTATYIDKKDEEFALSLGAERFIVKPIDPERFMEIIESVLEDCKKGSITPSKIRAEKKDIIYLKEYNERLIYKLGDKLLELEKANHDLGERVKELSCLHNLTRLVEEPDISLEGILQRMVNIMALTCQYPDIACARIVFRGKEFKTDNFKTTEWKQSSDIKVHGKIAGSIEIDYLEEKPVLDEGPFLKEERVLIKAVAERLGRIAERDEAEEALRYAAGEWRTTFNSITDIIFITDKDYKLLMFNKTFADVFRMHPREVIGKTCYEVVHGKKEPWSTCPFKQTLATQKPASEEFFEPHLNIYLEVSTSPSFNEKGEVISAVHIVKDITERKKLEDKLKDYTKDLEEEVEERTKQLVMVNRHLEKADRAKSEFLASVSHELRTPLNSVIGFAEVLQDQKVGQLTQKQVRCVDNILTSGNHLLGLINDILDIAKIESGKMKLALSEFLFPELMESINVILKETAFKKNITIKNHIVPQVSVIKADERKMKQIIYNLLSNAIKFTPDGGKIDINTDIKDKELWFSVVDTGIGIKQEEMNKLFKTFQQIDSEYTRKYGGTGLGLSLTKKMVELHGGKIWAESELGKGTTFTFTIPLREGCDDQKNDTYH